MERGTPHIRRGGDFYRQKLGRVCLVLPGPWLPRAVLAFSHSARKCLACFLFVVFGVWTPSVASTRISLTPTNGFISGVCEKLGVFDSFVQLSSRNAATESSASSPTGFRDFASHCLGRSAPVVGLGGPMRMTYRNPPDIPVLGPSAFVLRDRRVPTHVDCALSLYQFCRAGNRVAFAALVKSRMRCNVRGLCRTAPRSFIPATTASPPMYSRFLVTPTTARSSPIIVSQLDAFDCPRNSCSADDLVPLFASAKQRRSSVAVQEDSNKTGESKDSATTAHLQSARSPTTRDTAARPHSSKEAHAGFSFSFPKTGGYVSSNDLRNGSCVIIGDQAFRVLQFQSVKMARAAAYVRARLKNLLTAATIDHSFRSDEKLRVPEITVTEATFTGFRSGASRGSHGAKKAGAKHQETEIAAALRAVGLERPEAKRDTVLVFANRDTWEDILISDRDIVERISGFLKEGMDVRFGLWDGKVIDVALPATEAYTVKEISGEKIESGRGAPSRKQAILETGARVSVPHFIEEGDRIVVRTGNGDFVKRVG
ncbi:elongation factor p (ef-p) kow family domain-containing protein [Cystoisospora suis]|uniref:Elongation factor p (Ef-p) kow family domain-containing protein n=1 Tax=Cystoisospora suis TaxID=483139 RepID=A0A2C6KKK4_9APIC|nr:elongation factor p (ef-p) kow family domain-containing protein [Cystoisospora suis]